MRRTTRYGMLAAIVVLLAVGIGVAVDRQGRDDTTSVAGRTTTTTGTTTTTTPGSGQAGPVPSTPPPTAALAEPATTVPAPSTTVPATAAAPSTTVPVAATTTTVAVAGNGVPPTTLPAPMAKTGGEELFGPGLLLVAAGLFVRRLVARRP